MRILKAIALLVLLCAVSHTSLAQFYDTGRGRTSTRWMQIDSSDYKVVFPRGYDTPAQSVSRLMDTIRPYINYGMSSVSPHKVPVVLQTQSVYSNGYVTWAPFRQEMTMTPPLDTYAQQWKRQLTVHEWRHVVQLSSLRNGLTKVASWFLGQGGAALGLLVVSRWILEGDATMAETQFAEYGRGKQPDFTVEYRALLADGVDDFRDMDRWICGSYRFHYPDYYKFGYQVMSAADTYFGSDYFGSMMDYCGRWPVLVFPTTVFLKRNYGVKYKDIAVRAFGHLDSLWTPLAQVDENFEHITPSDIYNYTNYSDPLAVEGRLVALRRTQDRYNQFVDLESGEVLRTVGVVSSPAVSVGSRVYYTEYRPHPIFEQVSYSVIREFDVLSGGGVRSHHKWSNNWVVTPMGDAGFATISMDSLSSSVINLYDGDFGYLRTIGFGQYGDFSLHGLAYDSVSGMLCFLALDRRGMWLGGVGVESGDVVEFTRPNVVSLRDLTASGGRLYYSSIQSGKNEVHSFDLKGGMGGVGGVERRLTDSRFGSGMPVVVGDTLFFTTYTSGGWMLAKQELGVEPVEDSIPWSRLPLDILNPGWREWDVPKVDTIELQATAGQGGHPEAVSAEKYRSEFPVHTWAPVSVDSDILTLDRMPVLAFGASAFFQSTLSTYSGMATYGWLNNSHWVKGVLNYSKLPVQFTISGEYGGGSRLVYGRPTETTSSGQGFGKQYCGGSLTASLPLYFSHNGFSQLFQPSVSLSYSNTMVLNPQTQNYTNALGQYNAQLWWSSNRYMATRNLLPRYGYALRFNIAGAMNKSFATQYMLFARGYFPGFFPSHSVSMRVGLQTQRVRSYNFSSKALYLTAVSDNYATQNYGAAMMDYSFPVFYPDWGWDGIVYFNRVSATLFGGYSRGEYVRFADGGVRDDLWLSNSTYGVSVDVDMLLISSFSPSLKLTFAMPNGSPYFGVGFNFAL